jgi:hypothetical protein
LPETPRLEIATEVSPLTVLVRGVLEWACPDAFFRDAFDRTCRPHRWDRKLAIAAITRLMLTVVAGARRSVFAAYRADRAADCPTITATAAALYSKYGRIDPAYSTELVRGSARRMGSLMEAAGARHLPGWEGYRIRILDGTCLGGTEHRLAPLRRIKAAGLPGRLVAAYDPATGLVVAVAASEDAYTAERELAASLVASASPGELYVADRLYGTTAILFGLADRGAYFVVRQGDLLRWRPLGMAEPLGRVATGMAREQRVEVEETATGRRVEMRRVILELDTPTEDGESEVVLLTNLRGISGLRICELYRRRWAIEVHFSLTKAVLRGEIESLGQPRAALLAMCLALVAGNALAVVKQALKVSHGVEEFDKLSGYYLADEVAANYRAVDVLVARAEWEGLAAAAPAPFWVWCREAGSRVRMDAFRKHPRGPKRPQPPRRGGADRHHYSTYRLLEEAKRKC